jgi:BirA family biotin operon repressor/biotin-[acetyl-CoA-carboxylase] ligase
MAEMFLDSEALLASTFVRHVEIYETLGSTNDRAAMLARYPSNELPALIVARLQSAGKGRGPNKWWSANGALTFSVLLDSSMLGISTQDWPLLSLATAVAVCDAISSELPQAAPSLKWPNDVYIDGRKVCGILIESPGGAAPIKNRLVIGVGINVNNSWRDAPHDIVHNGIALCDATGVNHDLQSVLMRTLKAMQDRYRQLGNGNPKLPQAWQRLSWLTGRRINVETNGSNITGVCIGIDDTGALLVEKADGLQRVRSGSVRIA